MSTSTEGPRALLQRALASERVHSAYLLYGPGDAPRDAALRFARGLVCTGEGERPCERCAGCQRSAPGEPIEIDGTGKRGPLLRHVGDHPDLYWIERGAGDTRVRIGQIRALQNALRLRSHEAGRRAAVIADAEWLNQESQNALLRLLEEPPPDTTLVLVAAAAAGLLTTVRSRCQRVPFRSADADPLADDPDLARRLAGLGAAGVPEILDWAAELRGDRTSAAAAAQSLLDAGSAWLRRSVGGAVRAPGRDVRAALESHRVLADCRKALAQRNANPQMVAERALLALREAAQR